MANFNLANEHLTSIISSYEKVDICDDSPPQNIELLVRALMLLSELHVISNNPGGAVEELLQAEKICKKHRLQLLHCLVCIHLANNHLALGCTAKALSLLRQSLPFLLAHGNLRDRSRGLLLIGKCRVAASADLSAVERRTELLDGAGQVGLAKDGFIQLSQWDRVKDCLYLQARIYHSLSLAQERNLAARQYKKYDQLYPTLSPTNHLLLV
eukprot:TRINITY_DN16034_c0_g1_i1.p1 TRINITY_DN16034_c0_g1~~TRINITY_DN16034_c0_g1_i1.p1  ORF type:complete len:243 (+),score=4.57 TRINITY_DN16034_c0_g1_i1:96-731(+)